MLPEEVAAVEAPKLLFDVITLMTIFGSIPSWLNCALMFLTQSKASEDVWEANGGWSCSILAMGVEAAGLVSVGVVVLCWGKSTFTWVP